MPGRGKTQPSGFGNRLKEAREVKGWSQKELGEKADVHPNTIAKLERGDQEPNWPLVLKLATALGVECTAFNVATGDDTDDKPTKKPADDPAPVKSPAKKKGGKK